MTQQEVVEGIAKRAVRAAYRRLGPEVSDEELGNAAIVELATAVESLLRLAIHRRGQFAAVAAGFSPEAAFFPPDNRLSAAMKDASAVLAHLGVTHAPI
jgi:hypothetical protein